MEIKYIMTNFYLHIIFHLFNKKYNYVRNKNAKTSADNLLNLIKINNHKTHLLLQIMEALQILRLLIIDYLDALLYQYTGKTIYSRT